MQPVPLQTQILSSKDSGDIITVLHIDMCREQSCGWDLAGSQTTGKKQQEGKYCSHFQETPE